MYNSCIRYRNESDRSLHSFSPNFDVGNGDAYYRQHTEEKQDAEEPCAKHTVVVDLQREN